MQGDTAQAKSAKRSGAPSRRKTPSLLPGRVRGHARLGRGQREQQLERRRVRFRERRARTPLEAERGQGGLGVRGLERDAYVRPLAVEEGGDRPASLVANGGVC